MRKKRIILIGVLAASAFLAAAKPSRAAQTYDLASSTNWTFRLQGETSSTLSFGMTLLDFNNDGKKDIVLMAPSATHEARTKNGSVYLIDRNLWDSFVPGSVIDIASSTNFSIRFDGAAAGDSLRLGTNMEFDPPVLDLFDTGKNDLVVNAIKGSDNGSAGSGSLYLISNGILSSFAGTGNVLDLASSTNYTLRMDGAAAGDNFSAFSQIGDLYGTGKLDLVVGAPFADNNSRTDSGSQYVIPHGIFAGYAATGNVISMASSTSYRIRYDGAVATNYLGFKEAQIADLNGDGRNDLVLPNPFADFNSRTNSGSLYIIPSDLFSGYAGTGNTVDLANAASYRVRYDGPNNTTELGYGISRPVDLDADGKPDMVIAGNFATVEGRANAGALYLLSNGALNSYGATTGNLVDFASSTAFTIRIDGPVASGFLTDGGTDIQDFDNDGQMDILTDERGAGPHGITQAGTTYVIPHRVFSDLSVSGAVVDLADSGNYLASYNGVSAYDQLGDALFQAVDLNYDSSRDLIMRANFNADNSAQNGRGTVYVIYNFPHALTASSSFSSMTSGTYAFTGAVDASSSITAVSDVQYRVDSANPLGAWTDCAAADGAFDSTREGFVCSLSLSSGTHTVYVRAKDANGVFTPQSRYLSKTIAIGGSPISEATAAAITGGATVTWTTTEPGSSRVQYGLSSGAYDASTTESDLSPRTTNHAVSIPASACPATIYYRVRSRDAAGNEAVSSESSVAVSVCAAISAVYGGGTIFSGFGAAASSTRPVSQPPAPSAAPPSGTPSFAFNRNLGLGVRADDVRYLQQYLNAQGFLVSISGGGAPGQETDFFGPKTKAALMRWQKALGIDPISGYFGPLSRMAMSASSSNFRK